MTKILKLVNLPLCATACAVMAHANPIDYAPKQSALFTELQEKNLTGGSAHEGDFSFSPAAGPRGQIHDGDMTRKNRKLPKKNIIHIFDGSPVGRTGTVAIDDAGATKQVPDAASTLALVGLAALGLVALRRK